MVPRARSLAVSAFTPALMRDVDDALHEVREALCLVAHPPPDPDLRERERMRALRACDEATRLLATARAAVLGPEKKQGAG